MAVFGWEESSVHAFLIDICGTTSMQMRLDKAPSDSYAQICRTFLMDQILEQIRPEQLLGLCFVLPAMIDPEKEEVFSTTFSLAGDQGEAGVIPLSALSFSGLCGGGPQ